MICERHGSMCTGHEPDLSQIAADLAKVPGDLAKVPGDWPNDLLEKALSYVETLKAQSMGPYSDPERALEDLISKTLKEITRGLELGYYKMPAHERVTASCVAVSGFDANWLIDSSSPEAHMFKIRNLSLVLKEE